MDSRISSLIQASRFPNIILVVLIHSYFTSQGFWDTFAPNLVARTIASMAVPVFFIISGYLFFINFSWDRIKIKYTDRLRSLLIPYLIWNLIAFITIEFIFLLKLHFDYQAVVIELTKITEYGILDYIRVLWKPALYPLWFMRNLMFLVMIAPIVWFIMRKTGVLLLLLSFIAFAIIDIQAYLLAVSFFYFFLGAYLTNVDVGKLLDRAKERWVIVLVISVTFSMADTFLHLFGKSGLGCRIVHLSAEWSNIALFGIILDQLREKNSWFYTKLINLSAASFIVYVTHAPFVNEMQDIFLKFTKSTTVTYFASFFAAMVYSMAIYYFLRQYPKVFKFLTGGRLQRISK